MLANDKTARSIIDERGLNQVSDGNLITDLVSKILERNSSEVQSYLEGKQTVANWLFGQVMRATQGKANPQVLMEELKRQLDNFRKN